MSFLNKIKITKRKEGKMNKKSIIILSIVFAIILILGGMIILYTSSLKAIDT